MKTLLIKEKNLLFLTNLFVIFATFIMSLVYIPFINEGNFDIGLIILLFLSTAYNLGTSISQSDISKDDMLLRSLSIDSDLIVKSKYVSALFMILNSLIIFMVSILLLKSGMYAGIGIFELINIWKIIVSISIVMFFISLILLKDYYNKGRKIKAMNIGYYILPTILFFMLFVFRGGKWVDNLLWQFDNPLFVLIVLAISLIIYFISYLLSARQYKKAEF